MRQILRVNPSPARCTSVLHLSQGAGSLAAVAAESMYGSDEAGLVWAYAFSAGQPGTPMDRETAGAWIEERDAAPGSFAWLHFSLSNAAAERWLREHLTLPDSFYDSLRENPSTRVEVADETLIAVVHDVQFFGAEAASAGTVTLCIDRRMMVSARTTQLRAVDRLRGAVRSGAEFPSPVGLLAHLLRDQADVLMEIVREAAARVDSVEDMQLTFASRQSRATLGLIRRRLVRLQRLLAPEPAALFRLLNRPPPLMTEDDVEDLRRSAEELSAAVADSGAVVERVRILQDELSAQLSEATNRTLYVLTVVTALATPFSFISGLFGMNVGGIPFAKSTQGFLIVFLLIVAVVALGVVLVRGLMPRGS